MSIPTPRWGLLVTSALLLLLSAGLTLRLVADLQALQQAQIELAQVRDVRYGLFNAEVWVEQIAEILATRIDDFELDANNRPQLKRSLERLLDRLLVEVDQYLRWRNAGSDHWLGRLEGGLRQGVQDWLLDFKELRARVPVYADAILDELDHPEIRAEIAIALGNWLREASAATFAPTDRGAIAVIARRHGCADAETCSAHLQDLVAGLRQQSLSDGLTVLGLSAGLFALNLLAAARRRPPTDALPPARMVLLTIATLMLLAAGVTTPMIEVEARIAELRFELLGEPVVFTDQVLYFQSKSILDVVQVLLETGAVDMIVVAVLIALFSLTFPAAKVAAGFVYYYDLRGGRGHPLVYFFALRSGKWSMADVLVVAILMSYIGFSGLVRSQLAALIPVGTPVNVITTDGTALQFGFFLFLAFVLASLLLSTLLEWQVQRRGS
ncbi:MAG: paraquat-inducible protein A [Chromatiaceae bacterium]|nr:MAG: paraquat-inducible protein A [Chromatiaceae bacterium]